jgi:hypothetical protein
MGGIPFVNIMAVVHLCFVAAFFGAVMAENWMELGLLFASEKRGGLSKGPRRFVTLLLHPKESRTLLNEETAKEAHLGSIRNHFWIDIMVELPLALGVVASGTAMAILVNRLTVLHLLKMALAACVITGMCFCVRGVLRRHRMLREEASEEAIARETRHIFLTAALWEPLMIPVLALGFWLGYHRILETIY